MGGLCDVLLRHAGADARHRGVDRACGAGAAIPRGRAAVGVRPPQRPHHDCDYPRGSCRRAAPGQPQSPARGRHGRLWDRPRPLGRGRHARAMARTPLPRVHADHRPASAHRAAPHRSGSARDRRCARGGIGAHTNRLRRAVRNRDQYTDLRDSRWRTIAPPACCSTSASGIRRITRRPLAASCVAGRQPREDVAAPGLLRIRGRLRRARNRPLPDAPTRSWHGFVRQRVPCSRRRQPGAFRTDTRRRFRTRPMRSRTRHSPRITSACGWSRVDPSGIRGDWQRPPRTFRRRPDVSVTAGRIPPRAAGGAVTTMTAVVPPADSAAHTDTPTLARPVAPPRDSRSLSRRSHCSSPLSSCAPRGYQTCVHHVPDRGQRAAWGWPPLEPRGKRADLHASALDAPAARDDGDRRESLPGLAGIVFGVDGLRGGAAPAGHTGRTWPSVFALVALTWSSAFVDYSTSGLENALSHALIALLLLTCGEPTSPEHGHAARNPRRAHRNHPAGPLVLAGPIALGSLAGWRRTLPWFTLGLAPLAAWEIFSVVYYGVPFPNTAYAKLATGIPRPELLHQGFVYLLDSLNRDPVTLLVILTAIAMQLSSPARRLDSRPLPRPVHCLRRAHRRRLHGGAVPHAPFLVALTLLVRAEWPTAPAIQAAPAVAVLALGLSAPGPLPRLLFGGFPQPIEMIWPPSGIADERRYYFPRTALLTRRDPFGPGTGRVGPRESACAASDDRRVEHRGNAGIRARPQPALHRSARPRRPAAGATAGEAALAHRALRARGAGRLLRVGADGQQPHRRPRAGRVLRRHWEVTRGPLFTMRRWRAIVELNTHPAWPGAR